MPIIEHPPRGTLLTCDFSAGFKEPEMVKVRPVVVLTPKIDARPWLCTVVALSTTPPKKIMPYHAEVKLPQNLPPPFDSELMWVKGDMVNAVGFHRLDFIRLGKDRAGKRIYYHTPIPADILKVVQRCVLHGMGLSILTKHLP